MNTLSTGVALVIYLLLCGGFTGLCWLGAKRAVESRDELQAGLRRLQGVRDELSAMQARLDKLAGRVYAQSRRPITDEQVAGEIAQHGRAAEANGVDDPELQAYLALQTAPPATPGKRGG